MAQTESRRALVVTCNFPPDAAVGTMRTLRLVRRLSTDGWNVDVVTLDPSSLRRGTVTDAALLNRVPDSVHVMGARAMRPVERLADRFRDRRPAAGPAATAPKAAVVPRGGPRTGWLKRVIDASLSLPDREVSWALPAIQLARRRIRSHPPDIVYSSGPPFTAHLVGAALARAARRPWVADFRDPWARAPWRDDRFRFEKRAWEIFERFVVTRATVAVFVTEANRRDFADHYGTRVASRFVVVPNGCDASEFQGLKRDPSRHSRFVLLHAGSLYGARNPAALFRAVARAVASGRIDRAGFRFRFLGRTGIDLEKMAAETGVSDLIEIVDHVPRRQSLQEMLDASALLILQPITRVSVPAKLYEYLAAGRPVLAIAEPGGETADLVARSGIGVVAAAENEKAIEDQVVSLVANAGGTPPPVARQLYDGELRAGELAGILERASTDVTPRA